MSGESGAVHRARVANTIKAVAADLELASGAGATKRDRRDLRSAAGSLRGLAQWVRTARVGDSVLRAFSTATVTEDGNRYELAGDARRELMSKPPQSPKSYRKIIARVSELDEAARIVEPVGVVRAELDAGLRIAHPDLATPYERVPVLSAAWDTRPRDDDAEGDPWPICGCGRDYLTVPLEEAHVCPRPLARSSGSTP